ncbi:hypothetical protein EKH55_2212 [Sinorhizobium alkalisoli]|nr:hypothetical protein EKH55_2212 [Sinorhizobium alkalisoli]
MEGSEPRMSTASGGTTCRPLSWRPPQRRGDGAGSLSVEWG